MIVDVYLQATLLLSKVFHTYQNFSETFNKSDFNNPVFFDVLLQTREGQRLGPQLGNGTWTTYSITFGIWSAKFTWNSK